MTEAARFFAYLVGVAIAALGVLAFIAGCTALIAAPFIGSGSPVAAALAAAVGAASGTLGASLALWALK